MPSRRHGPEERGSPGPERRASTPLPSGPAIDPQLLLQALPIAVYMTDADGRITFFNEAAAALWGHRPEIGKSLWCGSWRLYWPDGRPMEHREFPIAMALGEGRAIKGVEAVTERPDGTRVPFLAYPTPLHDAAGALIGAVNVLVDISERKRADETAQRLASIVESSDDAIVSKNLDGVVMSWNRGAERLFGYAAKEIVGKPIAILIPAERHDEEPSILERIGRGERIDHYETIRRRKDGGLVDISLTVSPVRDAAGRIVGASKIARDITERRRAQEHEALLLREMSHRVKNAFAVANALVSLSARSAETPESMAEAIRGRLEALGFAHELTLRDPAAAATEADRPTSLLVLAQAIVEPFADQADCEGQRITLAGPDVRGRAAALRRALPSYCTSSPRMRPSTGRSRRRAAVCTSAGMSIRGPCASRGGSRAGRPSSTSPAATDSAAGSPSARREASSAARSPTTGGRMGWSSTLPCLWTVSRRPPMPLVPAEAGAMRGAAFTDRLHPEPAPIRLARPLAERVRGGPTRTPASVACSVQTRMSRPIRAATTIQPLATSRG